MKKQLTEIEVKALLKEGHRLLASINAKLDAIEKRHTKKAA